MYLHSSVVLLWPLTDALANLQFSRLCNAYSMLLRELKRRGHGVLQHIQCNDISRRVRTGKRFQSPYLIEIFISDAPKHTSSQYFTA